VIDDGVRFLIARRADDGYWQGFSGGGENDESPLEAAKRELLEESRLTSTRWIELDARTTIPRILFKGHENWLDHPYVIPEYAYGAQIEREPTVSSEHVDCLWCTFEAAQAYLRYDSNKTALWELHERIRT
jgi:dATP pyrophosphohydrolase